MDRGDRRSHDAGAGKFGGDPASAPAGVILAQAADLDLQVRVDPARLVDRLTRAVLEAVETLGQVPAAVAIVRLARDPVAAADLAHRLSAAFGLEQHLQAQLSHGHHLEGHRLPFPSQVGSSLTPCSGGVTYVNCE